MSYRISVLGSKCRLVRNLVPEWCFRSKWGWISWLGFCIYWSKK